MSALDPLELADAVEVSLGGRVFKLPKLVWRQIKPIAVSLPKLSRKFKSDDSEGDATEADLDEMLRIVWIALTRAQPALTLDDLQDLPIALGEITVAITQVAVAAGLTGKTKLPATNPAPPEA